MSLRDDFARWRDDPITRLVFKALDARADDLKVMWDSYSWDGGKVRPDDLADTLKELRVRHDAYRALIEISADDVCINLGIEIDE